jgi:hypothetical protein
VLGPQQEPLQQELPGWQGLPQEPQLLLSVSRLVQVPLQSVWPVEQAHVPLLQL